MGSVTKRMDVVAGRKYPKRDGSEGTHWINVGEASQWDDGGISIRLHAVPVGNWFDGTLKLFERKDRDGAKPSEGKSTGGASDPEDSIPFASPISRRTWSALT